MMSMLGSWQFWLAVVIVTTVTHFVLGLILPKLSGATSGGGGG